MRIFIPSLGRAAQHNHTLDRLAIAGIEATMLVGPDDYQAYVDRFTRHRVQKLHAKVSGIGKVRQWVIDNHDGPVLMLDDDLGFFVRREEDPKLLRIATPKELAKGIKLMAKTLGKYAHASFAVREGANRCTDPAIMNVRCLRALGYNADILRAERVRFDRLPVMEDFDVALQLLRRGHESYTINTLLQDQSASNAAGGCSTYRTMEVQAEGAEGLARLHPGLVTVVTKEAKGGGPWATRKDVRIGWKKALGAGA